MSNLTDLQTPWCVHVAATLGIAGHLEAGPLPVDELAMAAGCDAFVLRAMLAHLVGQGVFVEPAPGRFALNDRARALFAQSAFLDLNGIAGRMAESWSTLLDYVRTGRPAYRERFGLPFWEDLAAHPEVAASFDALMGPAGHGEPAAEIELSGGWDAIHTVVDVGGGTGALLAAALRAHPQARGVLVDFPATVARARETFERAGVAARVTAAGQSFFDPLPPGGDLYLLKKVLNDWPEPETVAILRRCAGAARPDGQVLVAGGVAPDDAPRPLAVEMVLTGGRTNTLTEFRSLAREAGLDIVAAGPQSLGFTVELRCML